MSEVIQREYTPPPTGKKFMRSDAFMRTIKGPIGSGKSVLCVMEILRRCMQQKKGPDGKRRSRWAVIRNTLPQLKDTTLKTWFDWVPPGPAGTWRESEKTFKLSFGDVEAEILFRPLDTPDDVARVLSLELTGAWLNECREIPREIVDAVQGRLKRYPSAANGGYTWSGMIADTNPPDEDSWWYEAMEVDKPSNWDVFHQPSGVSAEAENRDNLASDYYEELMIGKSDDWVNVYVHGLYGKSLSGKPVYLSTFNRDIHLAKNLTPIPHATLMIGMDFGLTPAAVLGQMAPTGQLLALEEVVAFDMGIERYIDTKLLPVLHRRYTDLPIVIIGDPTGAYRVGTDEGSVFKTLRKKGFRVIPALSNSPVDRISAVEHFLSILVEGGRPGFLIDEKRCPMLVQGFKSRYRYPKKKAGSDEFKETPEKNDWSHVHDGCQYLCLHARKGHISDRGDNPLSHRPLPKQVVYSPGAY